MSVELRVLGPLEVLAGGGAGRARADVVVAPNEFRLRTTAPEGARTSLTLRPQRV
ncbi:hypothetical protein [Lentzea sp. CA-135723]|uniref:hypothetical protein n=1 Tax=Lentzea sp. CA-135723 TaxID=3239950 RepID=UPI003D8F7AC4